MKSAECQRMHWPTHKRSCKVIQGQNAVVAQVNEEIQQRPADPNAPILLPGEIMTEINKLYKQFQLPLVLAALNAFRVSPTSPIVKGWEEACFMVAVRRRNRFPADAPAWARYQVTMARRVLWIAMEAFAGEHAQFPALRTTRAEALQCVKAETPDGGLLVVWVCYLNDQPPQYIAAPYVKTFTPAIAREEAYFTPPDLTPGEWLQQTVDKASTSVFK